MALWIKLALVISVSVVCETNKMCTKLDTFGYKISRNTFRSGENILKVESSELVTCMQKCLRYNLCTFINFNTQSGVCYLMTPKDNATTTDTEDVRNVISSNVSSWPKNILHDPCLNHDCPYNTHCIANSNEMRECEVIGCVGESSVSYVDQSAFQIKTLWQIGEIIMSPCLYESSGSTTCTSGGFWSEFDCQRVPPRDCSDAVNKNYKIDTESIIIDVDGEGPLEKIEVTCDGMFTVINHNATNRALIDGFESRYSFKLNLHYTIPLDHIKVIKQNSNNCEQFLQYECYGSRISYAAWTTIHQQRAYYFAGTGTDSKSCACGIEESCDKVNQKCNCNVNDAVWRKDSGFITNITALPILAFEAGDTGTMAGYNEMAFVTIGPLRCQRSDK